MTEQDPEHNLSEIWRPEDMEREQILYMATHSTPLQRLEWLEEMLRLFAPQVAAWDKR